MGQSDPRHETPGEALSDNLERDIAQRRQRLAELGSAQKRDERSFSDLRAQAERIRAELKHSRDQLIADTRERTTLLGELDQLLQRRVHRNNQAAQEEEAQQDAEQAAEVISTDIIEFNPGGQPLAPTPTGTSEWRLGSVPPPRPHAGPPPTAPALYGPRAPEPPIHLTVVPVGFTPGAAEGEGEGDPITRVTSRPAAMRSAAFQPQARPLGHAPTQAPPPQADVRGAHDRALAAARSPSPSVSEAPGPQGSAPRPPAPEPRAAAARASPEAPQVAMAVEVELDGSLGFSERVSEGGLVVSTDLTRRVGERLPVQFTLPGHHRAIACEAEVFRVTHSATPSGAARGMSLRFVRLSAHDRAALSRFIAQREALLE